MSNQNTTDTEHSATNSNPRSSPDQQPASENRDQTDPENTLKEILAQVEVLQEENRRLRTDYVRARQSEYRRAAIALSVLGSIAGVGGVIFPDVRSTLFGLAGIGFVSAILIYYLTPTHVATTEVGERVYATLATLGQAISSDLGLQETQIYVPTKTDAGPASLNARLFIPLHTSYTIPDPKELTSVFVVQTNEQTRGVSLPPTGALLFREFHQTMIDDFATTPDAMADQLTEAIGEGFELASDVVADLDVADGRLTVGINNSTFGAIDRFDHPLPSFIATGLAAGLQTPVEITAFTTDDDQFDYTLTFTWDADTVESAVTTGREL